jgi:hypothetical protein
MRTYLKRLLFGVNVVLACAILALGAVDASAAEGVEKGCCRVSSGAEWFCCAWSSCTCTLWECSPGPCFPEPE